jgi:DNA replication and repair protein RecF
MTLKTAIHRIKLADFRNYAELTLDLDARHVVLTGNNGAGKTNLLEAVSFLTPGRGLRRATYSDVPRVGAVSGFSIFAKVDGMAGEVDLGTGFDGDTETPSRRLRVNGSNAKTLDELLDHLRILWLTPTMDGLFTGAASERRRFLDRLVLSLDPAHGRRATDFERAMKSRNRLLAETSWNGSWLSGLEQQMAELGIAMAQARQEMLGLLRHLVEAATGASPFPTTDLALSGFLDGDWHLPSVDLEEAYLKSLRESRSRDSAAGRTLEGPHRVDLLIRHREKDMEADRCSTGEQKALLVGLVLAHARLVANITGFAPVLLLDEIAAHLDEGRRAALFDLVDDLGGQAFMTGTDAAMFDSLGSRARFLSVANSAISG